MAQHYDALETRTQAAREAAWMQALPAQIAHAQAHAPALAASLAGVVAEEVNSLAALALLPVVRKPRVALLSTGDEQTRTIGITKSLARCGW